MTKQVMKLEYQQHRFLVVHDDRQPDGFQFLIYKKWFDLVTKSWHRERAGSCASILEALHIIYTRMYYNQ